MNIEIGRNRLRGIIHVPSNGSTFTNCVLMVAGAGGGLFGPSGIYPTLSRKLQKSGVLALRLDYRRANHLPMCVDDVGEAIREMSAMYGVERVVLVGWSFGGAVVISAGAENEKVIGVATVASQTYGTDAVGELAPRSLLLLHGTGDRCLRDQCSKQLYRLAREPKKIILFDGDDHGLTQNYDKAESTIYDFAISLFNSWGRSGSATSSDNSMASEASQPEKVAGKKRKSSLGGGVFSSSARPFSSSSSSSHNSASSSSLSSSPLGGMTSGVMLVSHDKRPVKIGALLGGLFGRRRKGCSVLQMEPSCLLQQKSEASLLDDVVR